MKLSLSRAIGVGALGGLLIVGAACSSAPKSVTAPQLFLKGTYYATTPGPVAQVTFDPSGTFSATETAPCAGSCVQTGTYSIDSARQELTLVSDSTGSTITVSVKVFQAEAMQEDTSATQSLKPAGICLTNNCCTTINCQNQFSLLNPGNQYYGSGCNYGQTFMTNMSSYGCNAFSNGSFGSGGGGILGELFQLLPMISQLFGNNSSSGSGSGSTTTTSTPQTFGQQGVCGTNGTACLPAGTTCQASGQCDSGLCNGTCQAPATQPGQPQVPTGATSTSTCNDAQYQVTFYTMPSPPNLVVLVPLQAANGSVPPPETLSQDAAPSMSGSDPNQPAETFNTVYMSSPAAQGTYTVGQTAAANDPTGQGKVYALVYGGPTSAGTLADTTPIPCTTASGQ